MTGALQPYRVLEFGPNIVGHVLGMLMADQGAEVVKIEPPGGDPLRGRPEFAVWNRGKKSVVLDLGRPTDLALACELVKTADVVVDNETPGVLDRLDLSYEGCRRLNERIVYVSLPAFADGSAGRDLPPIEAIEAIVAASAGIYTDRSEDGSGGPQFVAMPCASVFGAMTAAPAVAAALLHRERTGEGQRVEVPLYDAMFGAIGSNLSKHEPQEDGPPPDISPAMRRLYRCKDGRWVNIRADYPRALKPLLEAAGKPEWYGPLMDAEHLKRHPDELRLWSDRVSAMWMKRTAAEWEELMTAAPVTVCRTIEEWMDTAQARKSGAVTQVHDAAVGPMLQAGLQVRLSETPGGIAGGAPTLGEHTEAVTTSLPRAQPDVGVVSQGGQTAGALDGVRILDFTMILAGPTCGRTLAEFGADVIKIDKQERPPGLYQWLDVARGKRSVCLDLRKPEGQEAIARLAGTADVIVEGFRKGVADRLGIGYERVRRRRPDIIHVSINAFGQEGPWALRPGFEQNAQAATGMQVRYGGRSGTPLISPYTFNDYGSGLMAAYGVILALLERSRTGRGQRLHTALSYTASTFSSPFLIDYPGFERREIEGPRARGHNALSRLYQASDGWLFLAATDDDWEALTRLEFFSKLKLVSQFASRDARLDNDGQLAEEFGKIFPLKPADQWVALLRGAGINAAVNRTLKEMLAERYPSDRGLIVAEEHPRYGPVEHGGVAARLSRTPARVGGVPTFGGDADAVLAEVGYSPDEIKSLRNEGVIPPAEGLPLS